MYSLKEFFQVLDRFAPIELGRKMLENGGYDNSGIIVANHDSIKKVLFTLDLTKVAVKKAVELGCDTVVTHHPAIYNPIKSLGVTDDTVALLEAVKQGLNVISMHLNLDIAENGIDHSLACGLGAKEMRVLEVIDGENGYGREIKIDEILVSELVKNIKKTFETDKIIAYGSGKTCEIASFCGSGSSSCLQAFISQTTDAGTVVTSDIPHHVLLALIERGKNVIIIPHYVSENYGFKRYCDKITSEIGEIQTHYFSDKRFM